MTSYIFASIIFVCSSFLVLARERRQRVQSNLRNLLDDSEHPDNLASPFTNLKTDLSKYIPLIVGGAVLVLQYACGKSFVSTVAWAAVSSGVAILVASRVSRSRHSKEKQKITYFLPLVMERLVMAVESGLDIIPAVKTVVEIERLQKGEIDPVTRALEQVVDRSEKGQLFEEVLKTVSAEIQSPALSHAFLHLGIAQKEGGELVTPLKELSDATQSFYQDSIEEELATLPVKATAPLVLTFAGLILFFLSTPLIQIVSFAAKAKP